LTASGNIRDRGIITDPCSRPLDQLTIHHTCTSAGVFIRIFVGDVTESLLKLIKTVRVKVKVRVKKEQEQKRAKTTRRKE